MSNVNRTIVRVQCQTTRGQQTFFIQRKVRGLTVFYYVKRLIMGCRYEVIGVITECAGSVKASRTWDGPSTPFSKASEAFACLVN